MKHRAKASSSSPSKPAKSGSRPGKGKAGGGGSGGSKSSSGASGAAINLVDIPLALPNVIVEEHEQWVPRYHAVLKRTEDNGIGLEDIDTLQFELEAMLAAAVMRKTALKKESNILNHAEKYRGSGKNSKRKAPTASPGKKGPAASDETSTSPSAKRFKAATKPDVLALPKIKSESNVPAFDPLQNEQIKPSQETPKPALPKNETPNRFWAFVEPYCAPITPDDIKLLEDLINSHKDINEYFRVPPLGQHYTHRWAKEDLENERLKSAGTDSADKSSDEGGKMLKKGESAANEETTPYGELTQRLVGGLMEENIMTSVEDSIEASSKKGGSNDSAEDPSKANLIKSLKINNPEALEARVRKELEEQGILNPDDDDEDANNDEILEELKRCQNELRAVSTHNLHQLQRLLQAAKEEMIRQELRNKLQKADQEVMEAYQKVSAARSKKKPLTKKERDQAWKALKERQIILEELESK